MPANIARPPPPNSPFPGVPAAARLAACKEFLQAEMAALRSRHEAGDPAPHLPAPARPDHRLLLAHLFDYALRSYQRTRRPARARSRSWPSAATAAANSARSATSM
jgi:hypothetical protein